MDLVMNGMGKHQPVMVMLRANIARVREHAQDRFFTRVPAGLAKVVFWGLFVVCPGLVSIAKNSRLNFVKRVVLALGEAVLKLVEFCLRVQEQLLTYQELALQRRLVALQGRDLSLELKRSFHGR